MDILSFMSKSPFLTFFLVLIVGEVVVRVVVRVAMAVFRGCGFQSSKAAALALSPYDMAASPGRMAMAPNFSRLLSAPICSASISSSDFNAVA